MHLHQCCLRSKSTVADGQVYCYVAELQSVSSEWARNFKRSENPSLGEPVKLIKGDGGRLLALRLLKQQPQLVLGLAVCCKMLLAMTVLTIVSQTLQRISAAHWGEAINLIEEDDGGLLSLRLLKQQPQLALGFANPLGQDVCALAHEEGHLAPRPAGTSRQRSCNQRLPRPWRSAKAT